MKLAHWADHGDERDCQSSEGMADDYKIFVSFCEGSPCSCRVLRCPGLRVFAGQVHGEHPMTETLQLGRESLPAPGAMVSAMHQTESNHR